MTAQDLHTRLGRMIEDGNISGDEEVVWSGVVSGKEIKLPVTGLEAGTKEFQFHKIDARSGCLQFGRVVP